MRISDWSSDVCSSDLHHRHGARKTAEEVRDCELGLDYPAKPKISFKCRRGPMVTTNRRKFLLAASIAALAPTTTRKFDFPAQRRAFRIGFNAMPRAHVALNVSTTTRPPSLNPTFQTPPHTPLSP